MQTKKVVNKCVHLWVFKSSTLSANTYYVKMLGLQSLVVWGGQMVGIDHILDAINEIQIG